MTAKEFTSLWPLPAALLGLLVVLPAPAGVMLGLAVAVAAGIAVRRGEDALPPLPALPAE